MERLELLCYNYNMSTKVKKKKRKKLTKKQIEKRRKAVVSIIAILLVGAIVAVSFGVSRTGRKLPNPLLGLGKEKAYGVDVSHHNGHIKWNELKDNVDFAIIRVGYRGYSNGEVCLDRRAKQNLRAANRAGVPIGIYFYTQAITPEEAVEEANFTLEIIKRYDISLPVFFDFEYASSKGHTTGRLHNARLTREENTEIINAFCKTVRDAGYQSGVYASSYMYRDFFKMKELDDNIYIWVADYNEKVTYKGNYHLWQFSDKGKVNGINKKVDENYWYIK